MQQNRTKLLELEENTAKLLETQRNCLKLFDFASQHHQTGGFRTNHSKTVGFRANIGKLFGLATKHNNYITKQLDLAHNNDIVWFYFSTHQTEAMRTDQAFSEIKNSHWKKTNRDRDYVLHVLGSPIFFRGVFSCARVLFDWRQLLQ